MEIKHKECFCPAFIDRLELQAVSKYARETWEFVNLYSRDRGVNRFKALVKALDLLRDREEVRARGAAVPRLPDLEDWISREPKLGMSALAAEIEQNPSAQLEQTRAWSQDVNTAVAKIVRGVAPFALVPDVLESLQGKADCMVVSQTPVANIENEWREHGIRPFVREIAGQEMGTKGMHLKIAAEGKYEPGKILMIGDAPGDLAAAREAGALFFPIIPGQEDDSWKLLQSEALERFFALAYAGEYERSLIDDFMAALPEQAPWQGPFDRVQA
jgi:phosphoglycolate phosphatase-like HAD superfamily hydrolase